MCGIAGRYQQDGLVENDTWAKNVSHLLRHRGPDGDGFYKDAFCELIHRRLALIDLTPTGEQPMTNEDGSLWITYNGEIYGFGGLRDELLRKGHVLRGTSDTEVLLHLYEECGTEMFSRINGIFAFAIYDQKNKTLLLARDRFGVKPLYYTQVNGQWIFASELKAILAWPGLAPQIDRQAVYDFLSWGYIPEPATGFKDIFALPKGGFLLIGPEGYGYQSYYRPTPEPDFTGTLDDAVDAVGERLQKAIRYQQVADVPVGSLLSGGIDSGLVTAAYSKVTTHDFFTFTVGFPDADYDESDLAGKSAAALHTKHSVISSRDWRLNETEAVDLLTHFDQPFSDTSLFAVNLVAKGIHDSGLRCAFSGDGGDEAFGGYMFFSHLSRLLSIHRLPDVAKMIAVTGSQAVLGERRPSTARQVRRAVDIARSETPGEFLTELVSYMTERQKEALVQAEARDGLAPASRWYDRFERGWSQEEISTQLTSGMFDLLLPGDMLKKVDMMSMKHSVEIRVPMLDESLIAFAHHLPHALKATRTKNKLVLRALAERWLPPEISTARKRGFGIPLDILAAQSLKTLMKEVLLAPTARIRAFIDASLVTHWVELFENGMRGGSALEVSREGLYQRLFFLFSLELWMEKYQLSW